MLSPLTKLPANAKVAVVGGGVSGLMFTYFLSKLRPDVTVNLLESQHRTGGWIKSWDTKDQDDRPVMLEQGPRTLRGVSDGTVLIVDTLRDLKRQSLIQCVSVNAEANRKFLLDTNDKLVQVPNSAGSAMEFLINPLSKGLVTGLLGEPFRKPTSNSGQDESVTSFIKRRFGNDYIGKNILSAVFHGIYGDDIDHMSAKRTVKKLFDLESQYGSIIKGFYHSKPDPEGKNRLSQLLSDYQQAFSKSENDLKGLSKELRKYPMLGLKGGLEMFPRLVRQNLDSLSNVNIISGEEVSKIHHDADPQGLSVQLSQGRVITGLDHIRLTPTPAKISQILGPDNQHLAKELAKIKSNSILLVNFYLPNKDVIAKKFHGFGYLCPKSNENHQGLLGVIFDSVIEKSFRPLFPDSNAEQIATPAQQYTKLTAMLGGHYLNYHHSPGTVPSKEVTICSVKEVLNIHLGISHQDLDAGMWAFTVADKCLPRFSVGYDAWQSSVEKELRETYKGTVSVGGMGFSKGPGVPDVISDGLQDALKLA